MIKRVIYSNNFKKSYRKVILKNRKFKDSFDKKWNIFINNPEYPSLKNHDLKGNLKGLKSISIKYNMRLIYKEVSKDIIIVYDIGTHDEVYK